jgi:gamma-glutamyl hercynylcysteine S-oxide synthase
VLATQSNASIQQSLLRRISEARRRSDELFGLVRTESLYERPIPERHRIVFYLGHLEAFDWNLLHENIFELKSFHPGLDRLFAFGIDPVGSGLPSDKPSDWPSLDVIRDYVRKIRFELDDKLQSKSRDENSLDMMLNVAIEHRLMHLETLAYMLHQLPINQKIKRTSSPIARRMIEIPDGMATLGLSRNKEIFGWDNEFETYSTHVPAFEIDQYMITNRQYLDFMTAGGYENPSFWNDADWRWKTSQSISHPVFWKKSENQWLYRAMFDEIPLPLDWPVYVSHAEATAFARWSGKSLPTEEEWHRAAYGTHRGSERFYPWGQELPDSRFGNFDFQRWDPEPVNASPDGASALGVHGMLGNGWEWTSTVFAPFPDFEPFPFYRGYSADFFDGKHFVMKGGSARTAACMLRPTFRNWFQAHYQYAYAGFRCVRR